MNTKTLLLLGVVGAVGLGSASAQVYSVNAVGYVNLTLKPGFNLVANPLNASNNALSTIIPAPPEGTQVFKWTGVTYAVSAYEFGAWDNPGLELNPGEGAFVNVPGAADVTVTFVGEVPTGTLQNQIPAGFSIRSSIVPQAGPISSALGLAALEGTLIYQFNATTKTYSIDAFEFETWTNPGGPTIAVGEAFWINSPAATTWSRTFNIN